MNAPTRLAGAWTAEELSPEDKARFLAQGQERAEAIAGTKLAFRRFALLIGGAGAVIGVCGIVAATAVIVSWTPSEAVYIERDAETGALRPAIRPLAAAEGFTEGTVKQHLRMYLDYCEAYLFATASATARRCQLFLAPQQQEQFAASTSADNPTSPQRRLGRQGWMSIADRVAYTPTLSTTDGTQVWTIDFMRVESEPGQQLRCLPWKAHITFRWRPDLPMAASDREINLGGMQILDRRSFPDPTRQRC